VRIYLFLKYGLRALGIVVLASLAVAVIVYLFVVILGSGEGKVLKTTTEVMMIDGSMPHLNSRLEPEIILISRGGAKVFVSGEVVRDIMRVVQGESARPGGRLELRVTYQTMRITMMPGKTVLENRLRQWEAARPNERW
jgi:hypothetical protein